MSDLLLTILLSIGVGSIVSLCAMNVLVDFGYIKIFYKQQLVKGS